VTVFLAVYFKCYWFANWHVIWKGIP